MGLHGVSNSFLGSLELIDVEEEEHFQVGKGVKLTYLSEVSDSFESRSVLPHPIRVATENNVHSSLSRCLAVLPFS